MKRFTLSKRSASRGLTLVSALVYVALLALVAVLLTRFASGIIRTNTQSQLAGEVIDNAQRALAIITAEIQQADGVYTPTSVLATHPGQLSLASENNLPADENITYIDFYVDDEHLYLKREGGAAALLTSARVKVNNLQFTHLNPTSEHQAVRIAAMFAADVPGTDLQTQTAITLTSTVSLRAY
ncbi:MAG: hypothetical protein AAB538_03565 [Patescibacteria group bacterium]